jgi:hypothetical protein
MSIADNSMNQNLNSTKSPITPSHEALRSHTGDATDLTKSAEEKLNRLADESALRAQNRIHSDEETTPGNTVFSNM